MLPIQQQALHPVSHNSVFLNPFSLFSMTRRDMESVAKRFWKYESTTITFYPLNDQEPRLGGKVQAKVMGMDF